jgi:hypothetical protein
LEKAGYCKSGDILERCCIVAGLKMFFFSPHFKRLTTIETILKGLEKYRQELYLEAVMGQQNKTAGDHNTSDFLTKVLMYLHFAGDVHQPLHVGIFHSFCYFCSISRLFFF